MGAEKHMSKAIFNRSLIFVTIALGAAFATGALGDDIGHEQARKLLEDGKILPLGSIVEMLREKAPGKLLETELEYDDGRLVYDFTILRPAGQVQEVEVDAATGAILKIEDDD